MTAHWEHQLQDMAEKKCAYQPFMEALQSQVQQIMDKVQHSEVPPSLRELKSPEPFKGGKKRRFSKGSKGGAKSGTKAGSRTGVKRKPGKKAD